ncbi:MAG: hypothetical protein V4702_04130 [Patescibacteria group bacterium]
MAFELDNLPTYAELGEQVAAAADDFDSLDLVEMQVIEEESGLSDKLEEVLDVGVTALKHLPDEQRRMIILREALRAGLPFEVVILGVRVEINPVAPAEPPHNPPFNSGDREPRNTPDPTTPGAMALAIPA